MKPQRPRVFIGSSTEGLRFAEAVQANLYSDCDTVIWNQGLFGLSEGTLESLVEVAAEFDFAVLVVTPDVLIRSRGQEQQAPMDNVLLEIGLFIGTLGKRRTFVVFDQGANVKLPSDLAGVTLAGFHLTDDGIVQAALGPACYKIKIAVDDLGVLVKPRQLRQLEGVYAVHPTPESQIEGERVELLYLGRRTFATKSTGTRKGWGGYITMSDQLPGYGNGFFRYDGQHGCGLHQVWINPLDASIDVHGVNMIGGTSQRPFTYTLRKSSEMPN